MKSECIYYVLDMIISDFTSNVSKEKIEEFKKSHQSLKWELEFDKAIKDYAKNKTRAEYIIEELYNFMKQENLLTKFDS